MGYPLAGLAQWAVLKLRRRLEERNHLLKNSEQFVKSLQGLRVSDSNYWIKLDIQVSGNKDDVVADALETFEGDEKRLLKEVMYLLLGEQRIMSNEFRDQIWRVCM